MDASSKKAAESVFADWQKHFSSNCVSTSKYLLSSLRGRYPDWIVTPASGKTGLLAFAEGGNATAKLDTRNDLYDGVRIAPHLEKRTAKVSSGVTERVVFGKYDYRWKGHSFPFYYAEFVEDGRMMSYYFILSRRDKSDGIETAPTWVDDLILTAAHWNEETHEEILVFDQQMWFKDSELYQSVKASTWDDVILNEEVKEALIQDVQGFFDNREAYKDLSVPWKRGVIFHGTPGNGKTMSLRALMNALSSRPEPVPTLYVKSLAGCSNAFYAIREIFQKARHSAPCLLVFEDLDSLITDNVKSFFLNEVDGLEDNDGLMMIGSTNYLERLDPGIAKRPGRFDRKYHFALPTKPERTDYCKFWRSKIAKNKKVEFPEDLCESIADITEGFSYAYLKEAFVTSLLSIVGSRRNPNKENSNTRDVNGETSNLEKVLLGRVMKKQVETLEAEMEAASQSVEDASKNKADANGIEHSNA